MILHSPVFNCPVRWELSLSWTSHVELYNLFVYLFSSGGTGVLTQGLNVCWQVLLLFELLPNPFFGGMDVLEIGSCELFS
jgi:hypothetical protein